MYTRIYIYIYIYIYIRVYIPTTRFRVDTQRSSPLWACGKTTLVYTYSRNLDPCLRMCMRIYIYVHTRLPSSVRRGARRDGHAGGPLFPILEPNQIRCWNVWVQGVLCDCVIIRTFPLSNVGFTLSVANPRRCPAQWACERTTLRYTSGSTRYMYIHVYPI